MILKTRNGTSEGYQAMKDLIKREVINLFKLSGNRSQNHLCYFSCTEFCFEINEFHYQYWIHHLPENETKFRLFSWFTVYNSAALEREND